METRIIDIKHIVPNKGQIEGVPGNPRQWTRDELNRLVRSIEETPELLEARPPIVFPLGEDFIVLGGNMRLAACKKLSYKELPCVVIPKNIGLEKLCEIVIKDNGSFGSWDCDELANNWDSLPLVDWGVPVIEVKPAEEFEEKEAEEDNFDESQEEIPTRTQAGDIWQCGEHRVMCGSATDEKDIKKLMMGEQFDLFLTDPPYNVDYEGGTGLKIQGDKMSEAAFEDFLKQTFEAVDTAMPAGAPFYIWMSTKEEETVIRVLRDTSWLFKQILVWVKNTFTLGRQDYQWQHEPCLYGWKDGAAHYFINDRTNSTIIEDGETIDPKKMKKSELQEFVADLLKKPIESTVIREDKPQRNAEHPTMKPIKLFGRLIRNSSKRGQIVFDSFGGSGTTLIACQQLDRKARIMELDPHYCDVILARWEKFTNNKAIKL